MEERKKVVYTADLTGEQGDWCWADGEQDEHLSTAGLAKDMRLLLMDDWLAARQLLPGVWLALRLMFQGTQLKNRLLLLLLLASYFVNVGVRAAEECVSIYTTKAAQTDQGRRFIHYMEMEFEILTSYRFCNCLHHIRY